MDVIKFFPILERLQPSAINKALLKRSLIGMHNVAPDGNCFYRAIIFDYISQLIMANDKEYMKDL